jgi:LCP family protein required for cell wall assembly
MSAGLLTAKIAMAVVATVIVAALGVVWSVYHSATTGLRTSSILGADTGTSAHGDQNILIMGLDSRKDENGNDLPQDVYDALHAGSAADGAYNTNVLMLLHVPGDGSKATSISIPRDDYVDLVDAPLGQKKGKIKQEYGLAFEAKLEELHNQSGLTADQRYQQARDAGRHEEIKEVRQVLGGVPIDHFVEVTMAAFYGLAKVVQPITICVLHDTQDLYYSGANFKAGQYDINAQQAIQYVRQRRDNVHPSLNFTDLDREVRQQAFISDLAYKLKQGGTFTSPSKISGLIDVVKQNIAVDSGLNLLDLAAQATNLTGGNITFVTLPIKSYGKDSSGEDVNLVDINQLRSVVNQLIVNTSATSSTTSTPAPVAAPSSTAATGAATGTVDVNNSSGQNGYAAQVETGLAGKGFTKGTTSGTTAHTVKTSTITYGAGEKAAAEQVGSILGISVVKSSTAVASGYVKVLLGKDFTMPSSFSGNASGSSDSSTSTTDAAAAAVPSGLSGGGVRCVK